jgi:hypothetical protein
LSRFCSTLFRRRKNVAILSKNIKVKDYALMQGIKMSSTLRISPKADKPSPRIVYRFGSQGNAVKDFLDFREFVKQIHRKGMK